MNLHALKARLSDIIDLIAEGRNANAMTETFDIIDDINDELNPQPTLAFHSPAKNKPCDVSKSSGWTDKGVK